MSEQRGAGRHAAAGPPKGQRKGLATAGIVALVVGGTAWWIGHRGGEGPSVAGAGTAAAAPATGSACSGDAPVRLATTTEYTAFADAIAAGYRAQHVAVDGMCSVATVQVLSTAELPQAAASADPPAAFLTGPLQSAVLAAAAKADGSSLGNGISVARSVSVVAVPQSVSTATGWASSPPSWADLGKRLLDPTSWAAAGHPEFATGGLAAAHPASSGATDSFVAAVIAAAQGASAPDQASVLQMTTEPSERAMLGVVAELKLEAPTEPELLAALVKADQDGSLAKTVNAAVVDERVVLAYNQQKPKVPLVAVYPSDGNLVSDLTLTPIATPRMTASVQAGMTALQSFLTGDGGRATIEGAGYRAMDEHASTTMNATVGLATVPPAKRLQLPDPLMRYAMSSGWDLLHNPGRYLLLLDVSKSMLESVPGTTKTKLALAQEAGAQGLALMPPTGEIGLWSFSRNLTPTTDWHELVPVGLAGDQIGGVPRSQAIVSALQNVQTGRYTALYDSAVAARKAMVETYKPGETNMVLLISDGRNEDPGSPTLQQTVAALTAQSAADKPVVIYTIAYGADADIPALQAIASATGGKSYAALDPRDIGKVIFNALMGGALGSG